MQEKKAQTLLAGHEADLDILEIVVISSATTICEWLTGLFFYIKKEAGEVSHAGTLICRVAASTRNS